MADFITLNYTIPDFGDISAKLYNESKDIYNYFKKDGPQRAIEVFEHLDHLGELKTVYPHIHTTRWEYIMLQLYLIEEFKLTHKGLGFGKDIKLGKISISSAAELMKCWIFLSNYGHLKSTFELERIWLEIILDNKGIREKFIEGMHDDECKKIATGVLELEDYYSFHKLLSLFFLSREKQRITDQKYINKILLWIEMLKSTFTPHEKSRAILRTLTVYRQIRRLAHLFLDINSSAMFFKFNPPLFFNQLMQHADSFLYDEDSGFNKLIDSTSFIMFERIYASKEACIHKMAYFISQKRKFRDLIQRRTIQYFSKSSDDLYTNLLQYKRNDFGRYSLTDSLKHYFRLCIFPHEFSERSICKFYSEQDSLRKKISKNSWNVLVTPVPYAGRRGCIIDIFTKKEPIKIVKEEGVLINALLNYIYVAYESAREIDIDFYKYIIQNSIEQIFVHMLRRFIGENYDVRFTERSSPDENNSDIIFSKSEIPTWIKEFKLNIKTNTSNKSLSKPRLWELKILQDMIRLEKSGAILLAKSNVNFYDRGGIQIAEWDGLYFRIIRGQIIMTVIEAKSRKIGLESTSTRAKKDLLDSFGKLGIDLKKCKSATRKRTGFAYIKLNLCEIEKVRDSIVKT